MRTLKLGFTDTIEPVEAFFTQVLSKRFTVIRDDNNPEYLIFGDRNFGNRNLQYENCVKIFYTGENERFWNYKCHKAITFDHFDTEHHYRLPLYVIYDFDNKRKKLYSADQYTTLRNYGDVQFDSKKFCSFIVKNGSCQKRNDFFHKLSAYKKVDAAGPLFNNVGSILEGGAKAVETKLNFLPQYKFNMCFENSSWPGYATEKLYEAFMGKTIPIYWGSPTIEVDFNPNAFLNWHDYGDDELFLKAIKKVDNDHEEYTNMFLEPMFSRGQSKFFDQNRLCEWFDKNVYKG